jgi:hypothetical protein
MLLYRAFPQALEKMFALVALSVTDDDVPRACEVTFAVVLNVHAGYFSADRFGIENAWCGVCDIQAI